MVASSLGGMAALTAAYRVPKGAASTNEGSRVVLYAGAAVAAAAGIGALLYHCRRRCLHPEAIPPSMMQLFLQQGAPLMKDAVFSVNEVPVFPPSPGEVLVKVEAAAINPSDYGACRTAGQGPIPVGNECSGVVVATGGGVSTLGLLGRNVFCLGFAGGRGAYCEYTSVPASMVWKLPANVAVEDGCAFFVNPFTVFAMLEEVRRRGQTWMIHTAAASALGTMLAKASAHYGITVVHVVRRGDQAEAVRRLGPNGQKYVLVSGREGDAKASAAFWAALGALIAEHRIRLAFDGVAGELSGQLLAALPPGGCVFVYGRLGSSFVGQLPVSDLIYQGKELKAFLVMNHLRGALRMWRATSFVRRHFLECFLPTKFEDVALADTAALLRKIDPHGEKPLRATGRKWRVRPGAAAVAK